MCEHPVMVSMTPKIWSQATQGFSGNLLDPPALMYIYSDGILLYKCDLVQESL